jgi:acylphosphatase
MGPPPAVRRLEAVVRGWVQGVGFRFFVLREGQALGLEGWVANESGGSVRCVAEGSPDRLDTLLERLREGPPGARVDDVIVTWHPAAGGLGGFHIRSGWHGGD